MADGGFDHNVYLGELGYGATVKPDVPSWRNRLARALIGSQVKPTIARRRIVEGLLGTSGIGQTGMGLVDFTPAGVALAGNEAQIDARSGNWPGAALNAMALIPAATPTKKAAQGVRAFHHTYEPFKEYDWKRLGEVTAENTSGSGVHKYAMNLAKLGPWASEKDISKQMASKVSLPVILGGNQASYKSLDSLERAISRAGGPEKFRDVMTAKGYGHIKVLDEEFGSASFIGLSPDNFRISDK